jgi:ubiquinone/menaquinone biosynthesis C-methylase UbiE
VIFPWILERIDGPEIQAMRTQCVANAEGHVLEIGLGTGKTLPLYSPRVTSLAAIEPFLGINDTLRQRMNDVSFPIELRRAAGESIPFEQDRFDSVVVSLVLCSVRDSEQVLAEIHRVLKPGGRLLFFEHVASEEPGHRRWQERLNPLQRWVGCGCNLNRSTAETIQRAGFTIEQLDRRISREMPLLPNLFPLIVGSARKPTA